MIDVRRPEFFSEYLFAKGHFIPLGGKAPDGYYPPPNLEGYADHPDHQGEEDLDELVRLRKHHDWIVATPFPWVASLNACLMAGHNPLHTQERAPKIEAYPKAVESLASADGSGTA